MKMPPTQNLALDGLGLGLFPGVAVSCIGRRWRRCRWGLVLRHRKWRNGDMKRTEVALLQFVIGWVDAAPLLM